MIFAFGPNDSYFISNDSSWAGRNLRTELFDFANSNSTRITALTLFPDSGYFVACGAKWASVKVPEPIAQVLKDLPEERCTIIGIEFDASNPSSFIISVAGENLKYSELPLALLEDAANMSSDGVEAFWLGHSGAYAIISTSRVKVNLCNNEDRESLFKYMTMGQVKTLAISPYDSSQYFIAMADGRTAWSTPKAWHEAINTTLTSSRGQSVKSKLQYDMTRRQMRSAVQQNKMVCDAMNRASDALTLLGT
ncbi:hypothetical protein FRB94_008298 [Tulasnella sp. JGI-2019a]|nr:hypothetical protein FRB94_008298 [Tulasnella sp. JGI-2019a]